MKKFAYLCTSLLTLLFLYSGNTEAGHMSQPDNSPARVKERFDRVDTVVIARVIDTKRTKVKENGVDFDLDAEVNTFVVTRVFKGKHRKGDRFVLTTVLGSGRVSVLNDPPWIKSFGAANASEVLKEWLIYMNSNDRTQLTESDMTRPLGMVAYYLPILEKLKKEADRARN